MKAERQERNEGYRVNAASYRLVEREYQVWVKKQHRTRWIRQESLVPRIGRRLAPAAKQFLFWEAPTLPY